MNPIGFKPLEIWTSETVKDPTRGIGTGDFAKQPTSSLLTLLAQVKDWREELDNRAWEDGQGWDNNQINNDRDYLDEHFIPELEAEIEKRKVK